MGSSPTDKPRLIKFELDAFSVQHSYDGDWTAGGAPVHARNAVHVASHHSLPCKSSYGLQPSQAPSARNAGCKCSHAGPFRQLMTGMRA